MRVTLAFLGGLIVLVVLSCMNQNPVLTLGLTIAICISLISASNLMVSENPIIHYASSALEPCFVGAGITTGVLGFVFGVVHLCQKLHN